MGKVATELMLFLLSTTMLSSTHTIRHTHLNHHRDPLGESDVEDNWARLPWHKAILGGGLFSIAIQWFGLTYGIYRNRLLILIDTLFIASVITTAFITRHPVLVYHVLIMIIANAMVGFFAIWSVHHGCDEMAYARSERHPLVNLVTFNLLYHIEHHLFPAVPTNHLPTLAKRLDAQALQWTQQPVIPIKVSTFNHHFLSNKKQKCGHFTDNFKSSLFIVSKPQAAANTDPITIDNLNFKNSSNCPIRRFIKNYFSVIQK